MNHVCPAQRSADATFAQTDRRSPHTGFTLVELLVVIAIIAIGAAIAIPNFGPQLQRARVTNATNELLGLINLARAEAMRRGQRIVICATTTPNAADAPCADSTDWSTGIAARLVGVNGTTGLLRTQAISNLSVGMTSGTGQIVFNQQGSASSAMLAYQLVLKTSDGSEERELCVAASGHARAVTTVTNGTATGTTCL